MVRNNRGIICLAVGFVLMNLVGLDRSSVVWVDEVTLNDPAKELAFNGVLRSSVFAGSDGFDQAYFWQPPAFPLVTALVYKIFGFGIWQTRVPVVLFGGCAVAALYFVARLLLNDPRAALYSAILFAFNPQFVHTSRSGRMDAQCLFLALLGVLFYLKSAPSKNIYLALSGLCVGLSILTHPIGVVWAVSIALLLLFGRDFRDRDFRDRDFRDGDFRDGLRQTVRRTLLFGASVLLPVSAWLFYAMKSPGYFQSQFLSHISEHAAQGSIIGRIYDEFAFYGAIYRALPIVLAAYVFGLLWFLFKFRENPLTRVRLLVLFTAPFLMSAIFVIKEGGSGFNILHPIVMISIMLGAAISAVLPEQLTFSGNLKESSAIIFVILVLCNLVLAGIGGRYVSLAYQWDERDYRTVEWPVLAHASAGTRIWGAPEVWYAAVKAGASLRIRGEPSPQTDDFAVTRSKDSVVTLPGFHRIEAIGKPFPLVFGRFALSATDYQLVMWESDRRTASLVQ
jgi:hypothetical protein